MSGGMLLRGAAPLQRYRHVCQADKGDNCRDKISAPKIQEGKSSVQHSVTFVGAGSERLTVKMPEVRQIS